MLCNPDVAVEAWLRWTLGLPLKEEHVGYTLAYAGVVKAPVCRRRVYQLEKRALGKIRRAMAASYGDASLPVNIGDAPRRSIQLARWRESLATKKRLGIVAR